jgi:16S rRNA processing protein RimM
VNDATDWLVIGRFGRPHGVKGLITIISFTEPRENILNYARWHVCKNSQWLPLGDLKTTVNNKFILAEIEGYHDRDQVALLTNLDIAIQRDQLKTLKPDEYYWHELVGMKVVNHQGEIFGEVTEMMATGSNDVLVVQGVRKHLVPYLPDEVVTNIDANQRIITVDWDADF